MLTRPAPPSPASDTTPATRTSALGYVPALDGLRALAVVAVIAYHLGYSQVPGGYIGVEVFFVLSGWLVCALLADEHRRRGAIDLRAFWLRRARRLLPAVSLVIGTTLIVALAAGYGHFATLRTDAVAAIAYVLNWHQILGQKSYFALTEAGPSPLQHLWSLSIEEQFYLLMPLLLGLGLLVTRRRTASRGAHYAGRQGGLALLTLGVVAVSTAWRLALVEPGGDPSRLYYGTDTRAAGLLAGAALGLVWVPGRLRPVLGLACRVLLDVVAVASLAVLVWYTCQVGESDPDAFGWSLTVVQVASVALIAAIVHPARGLVAWVLGVAPMRWVGQRSYGIYLWHWPLIVLLARAPGEQPEPPARTAGIVAATLLVAALSYRLVEQPIRRHGLTDTISLARRWTARRLAGRPVLTGAVAALVIVGYVGGALMARAIVAADDTGQDVPPTVLATGGDVAGTPTAGDQASAGATAPTTETTAAAPVAAPAGSSAPATAPGPTAASTTSTPAPAPGAGAATPPGPKPGPAPPQAPAATMPRTTAIGDSVMVGAAPLLEARFGPQLVLKATVGFQMIDAPALVQQLADQGQLGDVLIVHLGANGPFEDETIDDIMGVVGGRRSVLLVNVKVPRRWEAEVNDRLGAAAERYPNVAVVDWHTEAESSTGLLWRDGPHLTPTGAERYADLLATSAAHAHVPARDRALDHDS